MYTHVQINRADAVKLYTEFVDKLSCSNSTLAEERFEAHFTTRQQDSISLNSGKDSLFYDRLRERYELRFGGYVRMLPVRFLSLEVTPLRITFLRIHAVPSRAKAGFYRLADFEATVESVVIRDWGKIGPRPIQVAQNITVSGPDWQLLTEFDTKLVSGELEEYRIHKFE